MMKRIIAFVLCVLMLASLVACSGRIDSKDDFNNVTIGLIHSSKAIIELEKYHKENGSGLLGFYSLRDLDEGFRLDAIDCAVIDRNIANGFAETYSGYSVSKEAFGEGAITFATPEAKKVYAIMFDKALAALKEDGTVDKIMDGYLKDKSLKYTPKKLDNSNGEFKIAIDPALAPYFESDGLNVSGGPLLEILDAVCEYLECDYTLVPVKTSEMTEALIYGKADFALGDFDSGITELIGLKPIVETKPVITFDYAIISEK